MVPSTVEIFCSMCVLLLMLRSQSGGSTGAPVVELPLLESVVEPLVDPPELEPSPVVEPLPVPVLASVVSVPTVPVSATEVVPSVVLVLVPVVITASVVELPVSVWLSLIDPLASVADALVLVLVVLAVLVVPLPVEPLEPSVVALPPPPPPQLKAAATVHTHLKVPRMSSPHDQEAAGRRARQVSADARRNHPLHPRSAR